MLYEPVTSRHQIKEVTEILFLSVTFQGSRPADAYQEDEAAKNADQGNPEAE